MKRDLAQLTKKEFDLLVIGGGIHGACIARDAALRGLSVALVDKGDFGQATSANSLKTIHGGLRYLRDGNLRRMRTMASERTTWMRIAPHLIHPMPCLIPTTKKLTRSKVALKAALWMNDLVSFDRKQLKDPQKHLPKGHIISRDACSQLASGLMEDGLTGGAIWYDAQMYNSERLLLSFILSAVEDGAEVANYVEMTKFLHREKSIKGINARDVITGQVFDIRAKVVVNSAGAWVDSILTSLDGDAPPTPKFHLSIAMNMITRQLLPNYAIGVSGSRSGSNRAGNTTYRSQMFFIAPWRQYSLIGTLHLPYNGLPQNHRVCEESIRNFIAEVNAAYPGANLTREDVYHIHSGFLPRHEQNGRADDVKLLREGQVYDHEEDGVTGLITVVGVKYTTAREVAERAVNLTAKKLGRRFGPCQTHKVPVYGGHIDNFNNFLAQTTAKQPYDLSPDTTKHLVYSYGSEYSRILKYLDENLSWGQSICQTSPVTKAEVIHAIREEMAQKLSDVVLRRTELGAAGLPNEACLRACADLIGGELGWDQARKEREIDEVRAAYTMTKARSNSIGVTG